MKQWENLAKFSDEELHRARDVLFALYQNTKSDEWLHTSVAAAHNAIGTEIDARMTLARV